MLMKIQTSNAKLRCETLPDRLPSSTSMEGTAWFAGFLATAGKGWLLQGQHPPQPMNATISCTSQHAKKGKKPLEYPLAEDDSCKDKFSLYHSPAYCVCRRQQPQAEPSLAALAVEGMSLDGFMAKHTSEDNASFVEILEESNRRRRLSKPWLFQQQDRVSSATTATPSLQPCRSMSVPLLMFVGILC